MSTRNPQRTAALQSAPQPGSDGPKELEVWPVVDDEPAKYLVAVSRGGRVSCLHKANGCWRARFRTFQDYEIVHQDPPVASHFTGYCRNCWPKSSPLLKKDAVESKEDDNLGVTSSSSSNASCTTSA